jgi:hypothetical protein
MVGEGRPSTTSFALPTQAAAEKDVDGRDNRDHDGKVNGDVLFWRSGRAASRTTAPHSLQ